MKKKVINLFDDKIIVQNTDVKYSELFENFLKPFVNEFKDVEYYEDIIELGIVAWNFGNLKSILPEDDDAFLNVAKDKNVDINLMKRMINYKVLNFKQYNNFVVDYDLEGSDEAPVLTLVTQEEDAYLSNMLDKIGNEDSQDQFEENYINRSAIILKPLQPFITWVKNLYPEDDFTGIEAITYLVDEDIDDLEAWITKKYDKLFTFELTGWSTNKKQWPQKRTHKMFREWFRVDVSTLVFDMERSPVSKAE